MPNTQSPYIAFAMLLSSNGHPVTPAELHGLLIGRSCAGAGFDADGWLADAAQLLETEPGDTVRNALVGLQEMVKGELTSDDMAIVLLLPSDDAALSDRATALGQWCQGFITGFGLNAGGKDLSDEARKCCRTWWPFPRSRKPSRSPRMARAITWKSWNTCVWRRCCCSPSWPSRPPLHPSHRCTDQPGVVCP